MFAADYLCDIYVRCHTCEVVGMLRTVGTGDVQRIVRKHSLCDVSVDITNVRKRGRATRYGWTLRA